MSETSKDRQAVEVTGIPQDTQARGAAVVVVRSGSATSLPADAQMIDWLRSPARLSIGVVEGRCQADSLTTILACDLVLMAQDATVSANASGSARLPGAGVLELLVDRVGASQALLLSLAPEALNANRALAIGLVDDVLETSIIEARVDALADQVAHRPQGWVAEAKALLAAAAGPALERTGQERLRRLERDASARLEREQDGLQD